MMISQFGSHEWLMNRESFPPDEPSITRSSSTMKKKVWWRREVASSGEVESASSGVMRLPVYSTTRSASAMSRVAKTPRPWIFDRRLTMGGSFILARFKQRYGRAARPNVGRWRLARPRCARLARRPRASTGWSPRDPAHDHDRLARLGRRPEVDPARERPVVV